LDLGGRKLQKAWRKLHNEELCNLYTSVNVIRVIKSVAKWAEYVAQIGEIRNAYKIVVEKSEGKRPLGRPRCRWEDNIKMDLVEIRWEGVGLCDSG
jgi:hypothetical protein